MHKFVFRHKYENEWAIAGQKQRKQYKLLAVIDFNAKTVSQIIFLIRLAL